MIINKIILCSFVIVQTIYASVSAADVYVSFNKNNNSHIDQNSVLKLLKAEKLSWDNGNSVVLMIDDLQSIDSSAFDEVLNMSKTQFIEFWRIKFFSGRALLPKQIKNAGTAADILNDNSNGVYIKIGQEPDRKISEDPNLKTLSFKY